MTVMMVVIVLMMMMDDQRTASAPLGWPVPRACAYKAPAPKLSTATYTDHQRDSNDGVVDDDEDGRPAYSVSTA